MSAEFVPLDELEYNYDDDLDKSRYHQYVEKYPSRLTEIFSSLSRPTHGDIRFFIDKGLNINEPSAHYASDAHFSNPLHSACEFRRLNICRLLIANGADPNFELHLRINGEPFTQTPLESYLRGHCYLDLFENRSDVEAGINLLVSLGAQRKIRAHTLRNLQEYKKFSPEDMIGAWVHQVVSIIP